MNMVVPGGQTKAVSIPVSNNGDIVGAGNYFTAATLVSHTVRA
jgi:hypothetical protein